METDGTVVVVVRSSLPGLLDLDTEQMMETQWLLVLEKFNLPPGNIEFGVAQESITCVETMDLSQVSRGSKHTRSHRLDLGFISRHDLVLEDIVISLLPCSNQCF